MTSRNDDTIPTLTKPKEAWQMDDDHSDHQWPTLSTVSTQ
jgi:hypothetical protein